MIIKKTLSSKETVNLGKRFSQFLKDKDVVLLEGSLGGGKTTFIQGVLKGLGYRKSVLSPSYTLIREYKTKTFFTYHLDLYRLDVGDLFDLGLNEIICSDNSLVLIEWGHKIEDELEQYIKMEFVFIGENERKIKFSFKGYDKERKENLKKILG